MYVTAPKQVTDSPAFLGLIPSGPEGVRATLAIMRQMVRTYKKIPAINQFANQLLRRCGVPQKAFASEVRCLHDWVRDHIRYVRDITEVETIRTPDKTIQFGFGDCDDKSVLLATLLETTGHKTRFIAMSQPSAPDQFVHVFVETRVGRKWVALDPTEPHAAGWRPPKVARVIITDN